MSRGYQAKKEVGKKVGKERKNIPRRGDKMCKDSATGENKVQNRNECSKKMIRR